MEPYCRGETRPGRRPLRRIEERDQQRLVTFRRWIVDPASMTRRPYERRYRRAQGVNAARPARAICTS